MAARADIVAQGKAPEQVRQIKERLVQTGNPFGLPPGERFQALEGPDLFRARAEVLYYAGCDTAYRQPRIAQALLKIFRAAEADFTLLAGERSTGKPLSLLGYPAEARAMAEDLAGQIRATRCRTLVTGCPSSFDAFTRDYPAMGLDLGGIEVLHAAQYLDRLLAEGRLARFCPRRPARPSSTARIRPHARHLRPAARVLGKLAGLDCAR